MRNNRSLLFRIGFTLALSCIVILLMCVRLFRMQVVEGAGVDTGTVVYSYPVKAARGEILDRYGRPLVTNRMTFYIRFSKMIWDNERQNEVILGLVELLEEYEAVHIDTMPLTEAPPFRYTGTEGETGPRVDSFREFLKSKGNRDAELDAAGAMLFLREKYRVDDGYTDIQARKIIGVRYEMDNREFSRLVPFTFAQDVDMEIVTRVRENGHMYPGVEIDTEYVREYNTTYAAHILGRVGKIYKEEYEDLKKQGYRMDATVGKDGIEKAFEQYLRGTDGMRSVELNSEGRVVGVLSEQDPQPGSNVVLTIDLQLQTVTEQSLASQIEEMKKLSLSSPRSNPPDVAGGAALVINVKTGELIASASYPTYNLASFSQDYNQMLENPLKPMINRVIGASYPPGSTFKMVTAVAGLESGVITPSTVIRDQGVYTFYRGYSPQCWIYRQYGRTHGNLTVSGAIRDSCNYFFYDVGRQVGIERLDSYARQFGLGERTGIEIAGEVRGSRANSESKQRIEKLPWYPGDTLQASIGQSYNMFTPLQLCAYIAALVNGGRYYEPHLLKYVKSYDYASVIVEPSSTPRNTIAMKDSTYNAVMQGMRDVAENGTASSVFRNYKIAVGGKTGSAQVPNGTANGVFIAFAPFDDPEIAVVVIIEHAGSGNRIAPVARAIFDAYFDLKDASIITGENELIQ